MKAVTFEEIGRVRVADVSEPSLEEATDAWLALSPEEKMGVEDPREMEPCLS